MLANQGQTNTLHPCIQEKEQEKPTWVDSIHPDKDDKHAKWMQPTIQRQLNQN
jgi:hypothetical protein